MSDLTPIRTSLADTSADPAGSSADNSTGVTYGLLSTYPPTQCGLATFSAALVEHLQTAGPEGRIGADTVGVVQVVDIVDPSPRAEVTHQWVRGQYGGSAAAAAALNAHDVAIIQHEFGIFGGRDGVDVLEIARSLIVPTIVVLHTVLVTPTIRQRAIVEELARRCVSIVTMTQTARQRLIDHYAVDPGQVRVIPHGAIDNRHEDQKTSGLKGETAPMILTWGLLGEGKGIEWAIEAMAQLGDLRPAPSYHVVGQTHPRVLERHGERYRNRLQARAHALGVDGAVVFDGRYLQPAALRSVVARADVILLPYDSLDQVTSGVLIEAVTAGKPVISTAFPHARELLASGAGLVVARQDPDALAIALRRVLTEPGLAASMSAEAIRIAPDLLWPAVAAQYRRLALATLQVDANLATA